MITRLLKWWRNRPRIRTWLVDVVLDNGETRIMCAIGATEAEAYGDWQYRLSTWRDQIILADESGWARHARITAWRLRPEKEETA